MASWLVRSSPNEAVWVRVLAGYIVLCSWASHVTLIFLLTSCYRNQDMVRLDGLLGSYGVFTLQWATKVVETVD